MAIYGDLIIPAIQDDLHPTQYGGRVELNHSSIFSNHL